MVAFLHNNPSAVEVTNRHSFPCTPSKAQRFSGHRFPIEVLRYSGDAKDSARCIAYCEHPAGRKIANSFAAAGLERRRGRNASALENIFERVELDLLWCAIQIQDYGSGGIAYNCDLGQPNHAFSEIAEHGNEHCELVVDFALGDLDVNLEVATVARLNVVF